MFDYRAITEGVHSQLYIGDYFADTLHFSSHAHAVFGGPPSPPMAGRAGKRPSPCRCRNRLSRDEWDEVRETVLPLFHIAAKNIEEGKRLSVRTMEGGSRRQSGKSFGRSCWFETTGFAHIEAPRMPLAPTISSQCRVAARIHLNLATFCGPCNQSKGPKTLAAWKAFRMIDISSGTAEEINGVAAFKGHGFEITRYRGERGAFTELRQLDEVPGLSGRTTGIEEFVRIGR